jgi:hypothetical protein
MDRIRAVGTNDPLPTDLLLSNLVIHISDIRDYKPARTHSMINHVEHPPDSLARRPINRPPPRQQPVKPPFRAGADVQCVCCGRWGHEKLNCMQLCTTYLCMDYISSNAEFCASQAIKWKSTQQKAQQRSAIRLLRLNQPDFYSEQTDDDILASLDFSHDSDFI